MLHLKMFKVVHFMLCLAPQLKNLKNRLIEKKVFNLNFVFIR